MVTKEQILEALFPIQEPKMKKSLVELGFVRDIMVKEQAISLTVILTSSDDPLKPTIEQQVHNYLERLGASEIHIRFRAMNEFESEQIEKYGTLNKQEKEATNTSRPQPAAAEYSHLASPESKTQFIAVASGKGGVGKSTVTVNLATALARLGKKVGIIDADIYGFSIPDMMGIEERPAIENEKVIPVEKHGVKVISMGFFVEDNSPVIWRGPMLGKMLRNFFAEIEWGEIDIMLLDLPPGTGDIALDVHQMIPHSKEIIVTTPHATAAFVAARAGAMARHTEHEILGVVENMAYYECAHCGEKEFVFGRGGGGKLAQELHTELLAQIPLRAPDNLPTERNYSPSVYKEDDPIGQMYTDTAKRVIELLQQN
ncbi:P-loop NTPase [Marinicrinis lubricantis]|uniref:Iron-sulfur cluster carrier protein n=1 Tax=Marinicrinis lubricantis TaxID=2086470 RepID=A0ABW1IS75_9BACL